MISRLSRAKGCKMKCCNCSREEKGWKNMRFLEEWDFEAEFARAEKELEEENAKKELEEEEVKTNEL